MKLVLSVCIGLGLLYLGLLGALLLARPKGNLLARDAAPAARPPAPAAALGR